jgi:hypothetical protein
MWKISKIIIIAFVITLLKNTTYASTLKIKFQRNSIKNSTEINIETNTPNENQYKLKFKTSDGTINTNNSLSKTWVTFNKKWEDQFFIENINKVRVFGQIDKEIIVTPLVQDVKTGKVSELPEIILYNNEIKNEYINRLNLNLKKLQSLKSNIINIEEKAQETNIQESSNTKFVSNRFSTKTIILNSLLLVFGSTTGYFAKKKKESIEK